MTPEEVLVILAVVICLIDLFFFWLLGIGRERHRDYADPARAVTVAVMELKRKETFKL